MTEQPRAIRTNGEGQISWYHLNLTRTLAPSIAKERRVEKQLVRAQLVRQEIGK